MIEEPESLARATEERLLIVREHVPLTGVVGTVTTVMSVLFTLARMIAWGVLAGIAGMLATQDLKGGFFGILGMIGAWVARSRRSVRAWRRALSRKGLRVVPVDAGTDVALCARGPVDISYRFAPQGEVIDRIQMRCPAPLGFSGEVRTPRLGALLFDGDLGLQGSPAQLACVTAPMRAALSAFDRPVHFSASTLWFAIGRGPFDVPADIFNALAAAFATLAVDVADPTYALLRISAGRGRDPALFDAARASAVLLADGVEPKAAPAMIAVIRAALAGDFEPLLTDTMPPDHRVIICRGVFRAGVADHGFAPLIFAANALPDTEQGCRDALGLLCAVESLAALPKFERLGEIGSMAAARWLGEMQFPTVHGLQAAADAARAAIHARLHVHGALALPADEPAVGGVAIVETGQLSAADD